MDLELLRWGVLLGFGLASGLLLQAWRLGRLAPPPPTPEAGPSLTRLEERSELQRQLEQAGFTNPRAIGHLRRAKVLLALLCGGLGVFMVQQLGLSSTRAAILQLLFGIGFGLAGLFGPTLYIDRRRSQHRERIRLAVPDALDFMQVCMEAGQSVDAALKRVTEELETMHPDLAIKFRRLSEALAAGASRSVAFEQLALDADNDDLRQFANVLDQATSLGASVSQTLRSFTVDLRDQRIRRTEAKANVLPTKMTLGSMLFTVPPLLIVLLAPSLTRLAGVF